MPRSRGPSVCRASMQSASQALGMSGDTSRNSKWMWPRQLTLDALFFIDRCFIDRCTEETRTPVAWCPRTEPDERSLARTMLRGKAKKELVLITVILHAETERRATEVSRFANGV